MEALEPIRGIPMDAVAHIKKGVLFAAEATQW